MTKNLIRPTGIALALGLSMMAMTLQAWGADSIKPNRDFTTTEGLLNACSQEQAVHQAVCLATILGVTKAVENMATVALVAAETDHSMSPSIKKVFNGLTPTAQCRAAARPSNGHVQNIIVKRIKRNGYTESDDAVASIMLALAMGPICKDTTE